MLSLAGIFLTHSFLGHGHHGASFCMDGYYGLGYFAGVFWYALSWDPSILHSFATESSMKSFAGFFPCSFLQRFFA